MPLDTLPPLGSWVTVYGQQAKVIDAPPIAPRSLAAIQVEFPPEVGVPGDLDPEPDPLSFDGHRCWVRLAEPTLTLDAGSDPSLSCRLAASRQQFGWLRRMLEQRRRRHSRGRSRPAAGLDPLWGTLDLFLAQLPAVTADRPANHTPEPS